MTVYALIREDQNDYGYIDTSIVGLFLVRQAAIHQEAIERVRASREGLRVCDEDESDPDWQVYWKIEEHVLS